MVMSGFALPLTVWYRCSRGLPLLTPEVTLESSFLTHSHRPPPHPCLPALQKAVPTVATFLSIVRLTDSNAWYWGSQNVLLTAA